MTPRFYQTTWKYRKAVFASSPGCSPTPCRLVLATRLQPRSNPRASGREACRGRSRIASRWPFIAIEDVRHDRFPHPGRGPAVLRPGWRPPSWPACLRRGRRCRPKASRPAAMASAAASSLARATASSMAMDAPCPAPDPDQVAPARRAPARPAGAARSASPVPAIPGPAALVHRLDILGDPEDDGEGPPNSNHSGIVWVAGWM